MRDVDADDAGWTESLGRWSDKARVIAGSPVNLLVVAEQDVPKLLRRRNSVWREIIRDGIPLVGSNLQEIGVSARRVLEALATPARPPSMMAVCIFRRLPKSCKPRMIYWHSAIAWRRLATHSTSESPRPMQSALAEPVPSRRANTAWQLAT